MLDPGDNAGRQDTFRSAVLNTLVAEVQGVQGDDRCVLLLGYRDRLQDLFRNANEGLSGRFAADDPFFFEDFDPDQLRCILQMKMRDQDLTTTEDGIRVAMKVLDTARMHQNFSNGRAVGILLNQAVSNYVARRSKVDITSHSNFDGVLVPEDFDPDLNSFRNTLSNCREELRNQLSDEVLRQLEAVEKREHAIKLRRSNVAKPIAKAFVFKGPSGTGKTTAARYMGKLFRNLGFLSTHEVVECSAADLIGQHVGQTSPKTRVQVERGLGRVLLVDQAHRLQDSGYADEAVDELVSLVKRHAGRMIVILEGDEEKLNAIMKARPHLASVFRREIIFRNLTPGDCLRLLDHGLTEAKILTPFKKQSMNHQFLKALGFLTHFPC